MQQTQYQPEYQPSPTQREHPILKELSNPQKTMSLVGVDLEARQFALIAALLAPLAMLFRFGFFAWLDLTNLQTAIVVAPFILAVLCFAFIKWEGRELSFIAMKKLQGMMRENLLVWRARPPNSVMWLRDSVQRYLPAEEPVWDMLKTNNGTYLRIVELEASSLSLASEEQQERMRLRLEEAYTAFDFPITEITRSRPSAMGTYIARLQDEMEAELGRKGISEHEAIRLRAFGEQHVAHLKDIVSEKHAYEHKSFVIITYNPATDEDVASSPVAQIKDVLKPFVPFVGGARSKQTTRRGQQEATTAYRTLDERLESVKDYYSRIGLTPKILGEHQALEFVREEAGGANLSGVATDSGAPAESQTPFSLGPTITLTAAQHAKLSEKAIKKHIDAAEEVRSADELLEASGEKDEKGPDSGRTPQYVGLGELAVNDRIAPDAIEIGSDMLRVGSSYHRTLYIYDLPETVRIGFLQSLAEMKYRIKIVKYIQPISTKRSLDIIGRKKSQLLASERTTSQGDVRERERKRLANEAAEYALKAVQSGTQRYYELAVLIHLEADSPDQLEVLTDKVKTKLDEKYASSRMALEEMFEGYVSCLPFGENHLVQKYCLSGILTSPLSCFSTFSSLEINHPRGVLYGTDQDTGAPVLLDDTNLSNRHKIVLGESGKGKTVLVKALSTRARIRGETCILIDPEGRTRYERVAKRLGGQFTKLGQDSTSRINPFDLSYDYPDLDKMGDSIDDEEDPEQALRIAREGSFNSKVNTLVSLIGLMATATDSEHNTRGGLSPRQRGRIENVITEVYHDAGINQDPDTHSKEPPTMPDFFTKLKKRVKTESETRDDTHLSDLWEDLFPWHSGSLAKTFDGPTNVDLNSKYLVIRTSTNPNSPEKAPLMFVLLDFLRGRLADPHESITCFIDEMWSLLKYPMAVELLDQLWRASRASGTSMVGITQDLDEFLRSSQAETIMKQSQTYCLLGQSKRTIGQIADYVDISQTTAERIFGFDQGEALLMAGQRQLPINIKVSKEEEELFHTDASNVRGAQSSSSEASSSPAATAQAAPTRHVTRVFDNGSANGSADGAPGASGTANGHSNGHEAGARGAIGPPAPTIESLAPESTLVPLNRGSSAPRGGRQARVYALTGSCAPEVAFSLAGMLSDAAKDKGKDGRVLMVDASGSLSAAPIFSDIPLPPADELVAECRRAALDGHPATDGGPAARLDDYLIHDGQSGLYILRTPDDPSCSAFDLADMLGANFDSIIVACSKSGARRWDRYTEEWLLSASRLAAVAPSADGLSQAFASLTQIGDFNHPPLFAVAGDPVEDNAADRLPEGVAPANVLTLPHVSEISQSMAKGLFHPVQMGRDSESSASFRWFAYNLDGAPA